MENQFIMDTLAPTNIPIEYQDYTGSGSQYIRFFYLPQVDFQADDDERYNVIYVQVDYFTIGNPNPIAKQIKKLMKQAGFKKNHEHEDYETDTKLFHYILRFYYIEEE